MKVAYAIPALLLTLSTGNVLADEQEFEAYSYGYIGGGTVAYSSDSRETTYKGKNEDPSFHVGMGYQLHPNFGMEAYYRYVSTEFGEYNPSGDNAQVDIHQIGFSIVPTTGPLFDTPLSLFARGTVIGGKAKVKYRTSNTITQVTDDNTFMFEVGGGVQYDLNEKFWLRGEYVHVIASDLDGKGQLMDVGDINGLQFSIGANF
ncbi:porin family protein [Parasalinivibrio latis]|uniref:outer membrane beta-barrel protein n=1 Tax=Parasalinivibrio latis TaxID=2952610 RepID=UPI0030E4F20F